MRKENAYFNALQAVQVRNVAIMDVVGVAEHANQDIFVININAFLGAYRTAQERNAGKMAVAGFAGSVIWMKPV